MFCWCLLFLVKLWEGWFVGCGGWWSKNRSLPERGLRNGSDCLFLGVYSCKMVSSLLTAMECYILRVLNQNTHPTGCPSRFQWSLSSSFIQVCLWEKETLKRVAFSPSARFVQSHNQRLILFESRLQQRHPRASNPPSNSLCCAWAPVVPRSVKRWKKAHRKRHAAKRQRNIMGFSKRLQEILPKWAHGFPPKKGHWAHGFSSTATAGTATS